MARYVAGWRGRLGSLAALLLLCAAFGWGADSACNPGPATLSSFGTPGTGVGCFETDDSFTNFSVTNQGTLNTGDQVVGDVNIAGANTSDSPVTTPWTVTETFSPTSASYWNTGANSGGANVEATIGYLVNSSAAYISKATNTQYPTPTAGDAFYIDSVSLAKVTGTTGNSGGTADSITVTEIFCIGNGACSTAATRVTLTATFGNNSSTPTYSCVAGATIAADGSCSGGTFNFATGEHVTTLTVTDQYDLVVHSTTTDFLTSFGNVFGEDEAAATPEPSTFILLGTVLVGIGFLRFRKRKV